jgi:hypothetical protein
VCTAHTRRMLYSQTPTPCTPLHSNFPVSVPTGTGKHCSSAPQIPPQAEAFTNCQPLLRAHLVPVAGPFLPLNPKIIPTPKPDIYPGLSKPLPVNGTVWGSWSLNVPDATTLQKVYDIGRQDAAFWATKQGLADAAAATKAMQATVVRL